MREIKFRAWDKVSKSFVEKDWVLSLKNGCVSISKIWDANDIILQQFTGLKDKNEVEIYEGDILSDFTLTDEGTIQSYCQVFWNIKTGSWALDLSYKNDKSNSNLLAKEINDFKYEISGNIHENPELLKK